MLAAPSYTKTFPLPSLPQWIDTDAAVRDKRARSLLLHIRRPALPAEKQVPVREAVQEAPKEESVPPHFTTPQDPRKPQNAEDYLQMLRADFTIEGRLNRKRYWVRTGLCIVLNIIAAIFMEIPAEVPIFFGAILTIAVSIYQIMFTVRRAHDLGRSGWYLLWSIVPFVNIYIAIRLSLIHI